MFQTLKSPLVHEALEFYSAFVKFVVGSSSVDDDLVFVKVVYSADSLSFKPLEIPPHLLPQQEVAPPSIDWGEGTAPPIADAAIDWSAEAPQDPPVISWDEGDVAATSIDWGDGAAVDWGEDASGSLVQADERGGWDGAIVVEDSGNGASTMDVCSVFEDADKRNALINELLEVFFFLD